MPWFGGRNRTKYCSVPQNILILIRCTVLVRSYVHNFATVITIIKPRNDRLYPFSLFTRDARRVQLCRRLELIIK